MAKKKAVQKTAKSAKKGTKKTNRSSAKRELIDTGTDKRYVRRASGGQFSESDDQGRSLAQDRKRKAKKVVKSGQGDRGDQMRKS